MAYWKAHAERDATEVKVEVVVLSQDHEGMQALEQLAEGGRLVIPLAKPGGDDSQVLTRFVKRGGRVHREDHGGCRFVPLVGRYGWKES